jgi:hypothetical protein
MGEKTTKRRRKDEHLWFWKKPRHTTLHDRQTARHAHDRFCSATEEGEVRASSIGRVGWRQETFAFRVQRLSKTSMHYSGPGSRGPVLSRL